MLPIVIVTVLVGLLVTRLAWLRLSTRRGDPLRLPLAVLVGLAAALLTVLVYLLIGAMGG